VHITSRDSGVAGGVDIADWISLGDADSIRDAVIKSAAICKHGKHDGLSCSS